MNKVKKIKDEASLRKKRDLAWRQNALQWSETRDLPLDLKDHIARCIDGSNSASNDPIIIDLGCGNAWILYDLLLEKSEGANYQGIDISESFILQLNSKFRLNKKINFQISDLEVENSLSIESIDSTRIFIACLSLIEMIDLKTVFFNISKNMRDGDKLILIVLDSEFEIYRMSKNMNELKNNLLEFHSNDLNYYELEIHSDNNLKQKFKKSYIGVLHKTENYYVNAYENNLVLSEANTINCYNDKTDQGTIFKSLIFLKSNLNGK